MKKYIRDSKMRAKLKGAAMDMDPTFSIGKDSLTPDFVKAVSEYIRKHELVKVSVLKNCDDDPKELAYTLAGRSESEVVQVIGRNGLLFKRNFDKPKIELP